MRSSLAITSPTGEFELFDTNATRSPAARNAATPSAAAGIASSPRHTTPSRSHATTAGLVTGGSRVLGHPGQRGTVVGLVGPHSHRQLQVPAGAELATTAEVGACQRLAHGRLVRLEVTRPLERDHRGVRVLRREQAVAFLERVVC